MTTTITSRRAAALALLGLAGVFAGCGSSSNGSADAAKTTTTSASTPTTTTATAPQSTTTSTTSTTASDRPDRDGDGIPDKITVHGKVGDTLELEGSGLSDNPNDTRHEKTKMKVTVKRVRGPIKGFDLEAGRKLIGVDLHLVNTGKLKIDDPQPDGTVVMSDGESGKQTSLIPIGGKNPCDDPSVKLTTGKSKDVCIAFDVPEAGTPMTFQFTSDNGYGDTGIWSLK